MKSHGLEPNNEPGPEQMEWKRREDRPHLQWGCLPSIPISLPCKSVILLNSILSANLKNKAAAKTLTSRKRRDYGRDGHSGLYLHYKRHLSYSQGLLVSEPPYSLSFIQGWRLIRTQEPGSGQQVLD